jgi:hypothetical protein
MSFNDDLIQRAQLFAKQHGMMLGRQLGCGMDGIVLATKSQPENDLVILHSAVKAHRRPEAYQRERNVYQRLRSECIASIRGCSVPQMLRHDDNLWIIGMTMVARPFVLDFAGASLDWPHDFSAEVMADWQAEKLEQFGKRWPEVLAILAALEGYGIYLQDVNPGNISFE